MGERYNAELFEHKYPVEDGRLKHPFKNEPFLDSIIEGQQHRLGQNENLNHNQKRELAEVISFSAVEAYFQNNPRSTELLINPSPPGADYGQNFIDVFDMQKEDDKNYVRLRRFAVSNSLEEHQQIAKNLTESQIEFNSNEPPDITLKQTVIRTSRNTKDLLNLYNPDQKAISKEEFENLKNTCQPFFKDYQNALEAGKSKEDLEQIYENTLKFADIKMGKVKDSTGQIKREFLPKEEDLPKIHFLLSHQPLRLVKTGCGIQGGFSNSLPDLTSASLFEMNSFNFSSSQDEYGTLEIHCDECGTTYNRTPGKLEKNCRRCGGTKGIVC